MAEKTSEQVLITSAVDGQLAKVDPSQWGKKVRKMRLDPTIRFLRKMFIAPIVSSEWTVVSEAPEFKSAEPIVIESIMKHRRQMLKSIVYGLMDWGWQPFEKIHGFNKDGLVVIKKIKPLLQDISTVLVDEFGDMIGVRNLPPWMRATSDSYKTGPWVDLVSNDWAVICSDVEGTNWYGEAMMRAMEMPFDSWNECDAAARRFDTKIAGAHWVVHYPPGKSKYKGVDDVDNFEIAQDILNSLTSSGKIAVPRKVADFIKDLSSLGDDMMAWKIEMISASSTSASSFVERQKYIDALKSRAVGIPERAIFEGQFGTKAEAEAHADFAIDNIQAFHDEIIEQINEQMVNPLLDLDFGPNFKDKVKVKASPLSDEKRKQLRELYSAYFSTPDGQAEEIEVIDWPAVRDTLSIPVKKDDSQDAERPTERAIPGVGGGGTGDDGAGSADGA